MIKRLLSERLLCSICLFFLIAEALVMYVTGGHFLREVPASSIFYNMTEDKEVLLEGQVYKKSDTSKNRVLYLKNNSISYKQKSFQEPNIIIYIDNASITKADEVSIGEYVRLRGSASVFEDAKNPGNFDQKLYYAKENLHGRLWCKEIVNISGKENQVQEFLYRFRCAWKDLILEHMGEDTGGVLAAILLNEKSEMDVETKELYQKIGISHVLAISGLHISFMGLGIYKLFRKMGGSFSVSGVFATILLTGYVMMVGFSVSVIRAYVMLLFRIGADITGRVNDLLTALAFSAALSVMYQPLSLMDASFYLSYGAICGIFIVKPQMEKLIPCKQKNVSEGLTSIAINIALFPIQLWYFFEFPTYSLVMNLIVIPLSSPILGLGVLGSIGFVLIKPIGQACFWGIDFLLRLFETLGEVGCSLPAATIVFGKPALYQVVSYYVVLIVILVFLQIWKQEYWIRKSRKYIVCVFLAMIFLFVKLPNGKLKVTFLDVGQGDCMFLKGPSGETYLIDGGSSDVKQVGKYRMEPFLKSQGVGVLDYVFVSHGDSDHYSGILEMIERQKTGVKIKQLVLPANYQKDENLRKLLKAALEQKIEVSMIEKGQKISEGKLEIVCVQPESEKTGVIELEDNTEILEGNEESTKSREESLEGNAGSMVLSVSFGNFDILCTGDVEAEGESILCENLLKSDYDVLKVAHHGSRNSTGEEFLEIVKPRISIVSAGRGNSYGHPHGETLERLKNCGSSVLQTMEKGAIMMETDGDFIDIFAGCR